MCKPFQMLFNDEQKIIYKNTADLPQLQSGEILVKNKYTTLCGSDIHTYTGKRKEPSPIILGHEIVGEIVELGSAVPFYDLKGNVLNIGDLVTWTIFAVQNEDEFSAENIPQKSAQLFKYGHVKCTEINTYNGGMATHCLLREGTGILKIPSTIPLKLAPIINCAVATVMAGFRIADSVSQKNVLIIGAGVLGLVASAFAKISGAATITLMDIDNQRLEYSKKFGVDFIYNSLNENDGIKEITDKFYKKGFDVIIDMSGSWDAMKMGIEVSAVGAQNIWIGGVTPMPDLPLNPEQIIRKLLTIKGMHNYNYDDFINAVDFMEKHHADFPFIELIEAEFPLEQTKEAFDYAVENKPYRVVISN
ncbi:zinc-binding dehydrogenase [Chryseobacterium schmidteae]|uniref:zinc-binding dehydrogenase n=1 Tax=Chryseobacterium schmidteae TaxID=2730404 RepID=UPI0015883EEB|nr:zinc-binding dehydrogenase [Chryseobacterium schmidteae]